MDNLSVIDEFLKTFSTYIDSGFGLLGPDVMFLTAFLIGIDITLAGLYWAMGPDTNVIAKFLKKVMYVGFFALILNNFAFLSDIIFTSFGQLGLNATGKTITAADLMRPGFVASVGFDAAHPLLTEVQDLTGPIKFFTNIVTIIILLLAWVITLFAFFFLSIQLFVTIIEFKLTTLAGFVLIPLALWNKTSFLAEKVLGNIIASGIKLMVLAIIIGIGSTIFGQVTAAFVPGEVTLEDAASVILASLAIFALGIFGPGIATGLVSGAPQLGAGAAVGTMAAVGAGAMAGAAAAGAGAGMAGKAAGGAVKAGASLAGGTQLSFALGKAASGAGGVKGALGGASAMAQAGMGAVKNAGKAATSKATGSVSQAHKAGMRGGLNGLSQKGLKPVSANDGGGGSGSGSNQPDWAKKIKRQQTTHNATRRASDAIRSGDTRGGGFALKLEQDE